MEWIYPFDTTAMPELAEVGGKGMSLMLMTRLGMPVPAGLVFSAEFFQPWLEEILSTEEWQRALHSSPEELGQRTVAPMPLCRSLQLDEERKQALGAALRRLQIHSFAVRSSSPEEDLEQVSFAGGYQTSLGVVEEGIEEAFRRCFASLFEERVPELLGHEWR